LTKIKHSSDSQKHFLDSSVARFILLGTKAYKQYFKAQFEDRPLYISNYVQMEIKRSYLKNIIAFYFVLRMDNIFTISDAITFWSNRYKSSEQKAVLQLISQLMIAQSLDLQSSKNKESALQAIGIYIKRFELSLRRKFKNVGQDATGCKRATVAFKVDTRNMENGFKSFTDAFGDVDTCRSKCHIDQFFLERHSNAINKYIQAVPELRNNGSDIFLEKG
jgi:hypothetical protein